MTTALDRLLKTTEGRTALCVEQTIVNVTELICKHLDETGMPRTKLAKAMGVTPGRVTQLLDGHANLTLASIAKALAAFDQVMEVSSTSVGKVLEGWVNRPELATQSMRFDPDFPGYVSEKQRPPTEVGATSRSAVLRGHSLCFAKSARATSPFPMAA